MNDEQPRQSVDTADVANEQDAYNQADANGNGNSAMGAQAQDQNEDQDQQPDASSNGNNTNEQLAAQADMDTQTGPVDAADAADVDDVDAAAGAGDQATAQASVNAPADFAEVDADSGDQQPLQVEAQQEQLPRMAAADEGATAEGEAAEVEAAPPREPRLQDVAPNASMEDLLRASEQQYRTLKHGDVIEGAIMQLGRDEVLVDIGAKTEGIIPNHELQSLSEAEREAMQIGDTVLVSVVQPENAEGHAVLSLDRARQEKSWRDLQKRFEAGEVIQAKVSGHNKGGLLVNLEGVRGFVPSSQISSMPSGEADKQAQMARLQNQTLPLKIIEINRTRNRLILSERQAVQEQRETMRSRLLKELEPGQIRPGTVTSIADFGAFVDIGGADGLIHLSELSWKRVNNPREVLKEGDHINVYVLSVDPAERKIALSLKRTQPEPWSTITENYHLGQIVKGTITQLTSFGAFARLEDGIEGLIHVSELAEGRVAHPSNVVKVGDVLDLKVIRIDPAKRRIGLSLRRVNEENEGGPEAGETEQAAPELEPQARIQEPQPAPRAQAPTREREREREERPSRQPQPRPQAPAPRAASQRAEEDELSGEPMGALAQALAAHAQAGGLNIAEEEAAPEPATAQAEEAPAPVAPEQTLAEAPTEAPDTGAGADLVETEAPADAEADTAGVTAETAEAPQATMPSAAEVEAEASDTNVAAEASANLEPLEDTEASPSGAELGVPDMQAESGSEGMPSEADQGEEGEK